MATTTERLARYETAQELLCFLFACTSTRLKEEEAKDPVATEVIAAIKAERRALNALEDSLKYENPEAIEQVIATYGPRVREQFTRGKQAAARVTDCNSA